MCTQSFREENCVRETIRTEISLYIWNWWTLCEVFLDRGVFAVSAGLSIYKEQIK
jgi:hypothetical protein